MDAKLAKYHSFRDIINNMLFWCGVCPYPEETTFSYRIITAMVIIMCSTNGAKTIGFCLANINKVSVFVRGASTAFGIYTLLLKVRNIIYI